MHVLHPIHTTKSCARLCIDTHKLHLGEGVWGLGLTSSQIGGMDRAGLSGPNLVLGQDNHKV